MFTNPFFIYIAAFAAVLGAYKLGWSSLYPPLSFRLLGFFAGTFLVAGSLAYAFRSTTAQIREHRPALPGWVVIPLVPMMLADIVYNGGVPLVMIANGHFNYANDLELVPHLHVFTVTFGSAFSTIRFADFLSTKRVRDLLEAALPIIYFVAIVYRGPAAITLVSWGFVYLIAKRPRWPALMALAAIAVAGLYLFGLFGNYRMQSSEHLLERAQASPAFMKSGIPTTFFWAYVYFTSPMANLELSVETDNPATRAPTEFVVSELVPDILSKRVLPLIGVTSRVSTPEAGRGLNVATMFGRPFILMGWAGMIIMFAVFGAFVAAYLYLIRNSSLAVPGLALLSTFVVFSTFQNMIAYSGVFLQLVWPLLLTPLLDLLDALKKVPPE